jgi:rhamnosyltransferase
MNSVSLGVVLITHNARHHLPYCLPPLIQSPLKPRLLLMNSSSNDGTVELARHFGVEACVIPRAEFNHGSTREWARKKIATDIVVMMTPDAYALDCHVISKLIQPIVAGQAACAYARQVPHEGADAFETFHRIFNYPEESHVRSLADLDRWGIYTFFFSDSFGAYLNSALEAIGGFTPVLTGEDTVACSQLLEKGYRVAYVAEAEVRHSHRYTLKQEFQRHFDTGLARKMYRECIQIGGSDTKRGRQYVLELARYLCRKRCYHLLPYAFLQSLVKWLGYKIGESSVEASVAFKKWCSAQDFYWDSVHHHS